MPIFCCNLRFSGTQVAQFTLNDEKFVHCAYAVQTERLCAVSERGMLCVFVFV